MDNNIYLCFECGTKNRVAEGANRSLARCAKCKTKLFPEAPPSQRASYHQSTQNPAMQGVRSGPNNKGGGKIKYVLGAIIAAVILAYIASEGQNNQQTPPRLVPVATAPNRPTSPLPSAIFQLPGIVLNNTGVTGKHPFEIITSVGNDYYVKLVDSRTDVDKITIFVHGGQSLEVLVPQGQYRMKYATGETWRGVEHLFGPGSLTSYHESPDIFDFNISGGYYQGYTVELIRQIGGNMDTHPISATAF